jgi:hypothetical protein
VETIKTICLLKDIVCLLRDIARLHPKNIKIILSYLNEEKQFLGFLIERKIYKKKSNIV